MKRSLLNIPVVLLITLCLNSFGQPNIPDPGALYSTHTVPRIDILIPWDTLNLIYDNPSSDREFRATFVFDNNDIHDTIREVGFRLRGNTSRDSWKKSFKVSFNTFAKGRKYKGVEKLDLNGEHNDPSSSRSVLYWHLAREAGIVSTRANHIQLFINGNYHGLYTNVEHIDEEFVKTYFGNDDGNLYKCLWPADLTYHGTNQNNYKFMNDDHRAYELKTNEDEDDYSDLVELIRIINNTSLTDLPCELEKVFNVQGYLKIAALDVLTSNWDGYAFNKNNFYLYNNPATGVFEYIPYDVDNSFGIDWFNINWSTRNIYNWASNEPRPLFKRLMQVPEYKAQYTYYIRQLISDVIKNPDFVEFKEFIKLKTRPYLLFDPYYPLDYGYSIDSYDQSWVSGVDGHVVFGIDEFIQKRNASALSQCSLNNASPIITLIQNNQPQAREDLVIKAHVEEDNLSEIDVIYKINGGTLVSFPMNDDGNDGDERAGDKIYTAALKGFQGDALIEYQIKATDANADESIKPCEAKKYIFPSDKNPNFAFWPNPSNGNIVYLSRATNYKLFDITGRLLIEGQNLSVIDVSSVTPGVCLLKIQDGEFIKLIVTH